MTDRTGSRGGTVGSVVEAQTLFASNRQAEYDEVTGAILRAAFSAGEFHSDALAGVVVLEPNVIGAAVRNLAASGYIEKLNRAGAAEFRPSQQRSAHGRGSWVWRLTTQGRVAAKQLVGQPTMTPVEPEIGEAA